MWKGILFVWHNPPSSTFLLGLIGIGMILGVIASVKTDNKPMGTPNVDR